MMQLSFSYLQGACIEDKKSVLSKVLSPDKNFALWKRELGSFLDSWASSIKWEKVLPLEAELGLDDLESFESDLYKEISSWRPRENDMNQWVASDIRLIIEEFINQTNAQEVFVKIFQVENDMCRYFHIDNNLLRLLCTYIGPGTIWLPNSNANREFLGSGLNERIVIDPNLTVQIEKLDVALLKGGRWPQNLCGGAIHRSPTMRPEEKRLILKVDFII